jgi:hypothetical protein
VHYSIILRTFSIVKVFHNCLTAICFKDLKDFRYRDDLAAARATLKKNSMMLLTTSKVMLLMTLCHIL